MEHRGRARAHEPAEFRHQTRRAGRLRAAGLDPLDENSEAIALLGSLDGDRPALRVEIWELQFLARLIPLGFERATECIQRFDRDAVPGLDLQHGFDVGAVDVVELPLLRLAQAVMVSRFFTGAAARRQDRIFDPCRLTHFRSLFFNKPSWPAQSQPSQSCTPRVSAPSTTRLVPVTKLAAGLARKTAALAISCGVPIRPVGLSAKAVR